MSRNLGRMICSEQIAVAFSHISLSGRYGSVSLQAFTPNISKILHCCKQAFFHPQQIDLSIKVDLLHPGCGGTFCDIVALAVSIVTRAIQSIVVLVFKCHQKEQWGAACCETSCYSVAKWGPVRDSNCNGRGRELNEFCWQSLPADPHIPGESHKTQVDAISF